jgi:ComF family protein
MLPVFIPGKSHRILANVPVDQKLRSDVTMSLSHLKQQFVNFLFEAKCCVCNGCLDRLARIDDSMQITGVGVQICDDCFREITENLIDRCHFCGAVLTVNNPFKDRCRFCRGWKSKMERLIAIGNYAGQLRNTIVEMKRNLNDVKAMQLGELLGNLFDRLDPPDDIDWVVPVPSHWRRRLSRRGLHIADVIAEGFCRATQFPKSNRILKCDRYAGKQSMLRPAQRTLNVRGIFSANGSYALRGLRILLIDDVATTGATIGECARVLRKAGVAQVYAAVIARGMGNNQVHGML